MNDKYIVYFISKTKMYMEKFIEKKLKENNMGELVSSHGNILTVLYENRGSRLTMKDIATKIGKDKSTVTVLVNKLIKLGYVEKEHSNQDKRIVYISLTLKAIEAQARYNAICSDVKNTAYSEFTKEEKEQFLKLLRKLSDNFRQQL